MNTERRITYTSLDDIVSADSNPKKHSGDIVVSMRMHRFTQPLLLDERTGKLIAGHGRMEALRQLRAAKEAPPEGIKQDKSGKWLVPVVRGWASRSDTEAQQMLIADNRLTEIGGWDTEALLPMLQELQASHSLESTGFSDDDIAKLLKEIADDNAPSVTDYSTKIQTPIYEVTGAKPAVRELYDTAKLATLLAEIEAQDVETETKDFLRMAAHRHVVFDYQQIAEFYAHASADVQRLMEASALVIVDFKQAVERGFVKLSQSIAEEYASEYADDEDAAEPAAP